MTDKHTPLPWGYNPIEREIYYNDGDVYPGIATIRDNAEDEQQLADGLLIMNAVNSHNALVAALGMVRSDPSRDQLLDDTMEQVNFAWKLARGE